MIFVASPPMVPGASTAGLLMAQASAITRDTVVMIQSTPTGWALWVDTLTSIATVVIALALIVGGLAAIPMARLALSTLKTVNSLLKQVQNDVAPLIKHGHAVTENLDYITTSARMDVERLNQMIASANQRLERAAAAAEERINDFNALLKVMQEEAEDLFIGTAATVRGVQVGTQTLRDFRSEGSWTADQQAGDIRVERVSREHPKQP